MKNFLLAIISILSFSASIYAQNVDLLLEKTGNSLLRNKEFRAVSIGVYKDGEMFTKHFGTLIENQEAAPTDETLYEIASVTKTFTGYLTAKAVLEGKISLDDDVRDYLRGDYPNLSFNDQPITIQHLVTHTAGLPQFLDASMAKVFQTLQPDVPTQFEKLEKELTKDDFSKYLRAFELQNPPGSNYAYSNAGAELMGYILTSVYEKTYDELLQDELLDELGMNNTAINLTDEQQTRIAQGYWMDNNTPSPSQINPLWATGSGLKSTLPDLMKWIEFNLINEDSAVQESHKILYEKNTRWVSYFWNAWKDKNGTPFNHHGGTSGTQNWVFLFPKYDLGISIIVNHSGPKTPKKLSKAANQILKELSK